MYAKKQWSLRAWLGGLLCLLLLTQLYGTASAAAQTTFILSGYYDDSDTSCFVGGLQNTAATSVTIPQRLDVKLTNSHRIKNLPLTGIDNDAFVNCKNLINITVERGHTYFSHINGVLCDNTKTRLDAYPAGRTATNYTIPDSITTIDGYAFALSTGEQNGATQTSALKTVTLNRTTTIQPFAFRSSAITSMHITSAVRSIAPGAFADCDALPEFTVDSGNAKFFVEAGVLFELLADGTYGLLAFPAGSSVTDYTIPPQVNGKAVTNILPYAFYGCDTLQTVTVPPSVTAIGDYAFGSCDRLQAVRFDGTSRLNSIGTGAFRYCKALDTITLPASLRTIGSSAFMSCLVLPNTVIPEGVTSIQPMTFYNCSTLTSVTLPQSLTSIGYEAFSNCKTLPEIKIPENVTSIGNEAFESCLLLEKLIFTGTSKLTSIGYEAFRQCLILTGVTLPQSLTSIGHGAFETTDLTNITIPQTVTSIGYGAFANCDRLPNIWVEAGNANYISENGILYTLDKTQLVQYPAGKQQTRFDVPDDVLSILDYAFWGCDKLEDLVFPPSVKTIGKEVISPGSRTGTGTETMALKRVIVCNPNVTLQSRSSSSYNSFYNGSYTLYSYEGSRTQDYATNLNTYPSYTIPYQNIALNVTLDIRTKPAVLPGDTATETPLTDATAIVVRRNTQAFPLQNTGQVGQFTCTMTDYNGEIPSTLHISHRADSYQPTTATVFPRPVILTANAVQQSASGTVVLLEKGKFRLENFFIKHLDVISPATAVTALVFDETGSCVYQNAPTLPFPSQGLPAGVYSFVFMPPEVQNTLPTFANRSAWQAFANRASLRENQHYIAQSATIEDGLITVLKDLVIPTPDYSKEQFFTKANISLAPPKFAKDADTVLHIDYAINPAFVPLNFVKPQCQITLPDNIQLHGVVLLDGQVVPHTYDNATRLLTIDTQNKTEGLLRMYLTGTADGIFEIAPSFPIDAYGQQFSYTLGTAEGEVGTVQATCQGKTVTIINQAQSGEVKTPVPLGTKTLPFYTVWPEKYPSFTFEAELQGDNNLLADVFLMITSKIGEESELPMTYNPLTNTWACTVDYPQFSQVPVAVGLRWVYRDPTMPEGISLKQPVRPIYDPSGYVYEAVPSNRLSGVEATIGYENEQGTWTKWDASTCGQTNPLRTDAVGCYAWDVPEGHWQVRYEKAGYISSDSRAISQEKYGSDFLPVPPIQLDINVPLVSTALPRVAGVIPYTTQVEVQFSQYMDASSLQDALSLTALDGTRLPVQLTALDAEENAEGRSYASRFALVLSNPADFHNADLRIEPTALNYAGRGLAKPYSITIAEASMQEKPLNLRILESQAILQGRSQQYTVQVEPAIEGLLLDISSRSPSLLQVTEQQVHTNAQGQASFSVHGQCMGTGEISISDPLSGLETRLMLTVTNNADDNIETLPLPTLHTEDGTAVLGTASLPVGTRLVLHKPKPDATLRYTLDGSDPTRSDVNAETSTEAFVLEEACILTAVLEKNGQFSPSARYVLTIASENTPAEDKPTETAPAPPPVEDKPAETAPAPLPVEDKPTETAPAPPVEDKPAETAPAPPAENKPEPAPDVASGLGTQKPSPPRKQSKPTVFVPPATPENPQPAIEVTAYLSGQKTQNRLQVEALTPTVNQALQLAQTQKGTGRAVHLTLDVSSDGTFDQFISTLPESTLAYLCREQVASLSIRCALGEITLDNATLQSIQSQSRGGVSLSMKCLHASTLPPAVQRKIAQRPVYELLLQDSKQTRIHDFGEGTVTLHLPYTLGKGERSDALLVYYITADNQLEALQHSGYDTQTQRIFGSTNHFSRFAVAENTQGATVAQKNPVFLDVQGHWAEDAIAFVTERGLFQGTSEQTFSPNQPISRAMFLTVLGRMAEVNPQLYPSCPFRDVPQDAYYRPYVAWAKEAGILTGGLHCDPNAPLCRADLASMLYAYAKVQEIPLTPTQRPLLFRDTNALPPAVRDAIQATQRAGLLSGKDPQHFDPTASATRAEIAKVLQTMIHH